MQDTKTVLDKITKEYVDLEEKFIKLGRFLWSKDFDDLSPVLKELLNEQYDGMRDYDISLTDRIRYLNGELDERLVEYYKNRYKENEKGFGFGKALQALKQGHAVARSGWNGNGIYIALKKSDTNTSKSIIDTGKMTYDYLYIDTTGLKTDNSDAPKGRVPWTPSQTDLLAHDWYIPLD